MIAGNGNVTGGKMLVFSRKIDEAVMIGDSIVITIVEIRGDKVRLGIEAPADVSIHRQEVYDAIQQEEARMKAAEKKRNPPS